MHGRKKKGDKFLLEYKQNDNNKFNIKRDLSYFYGRKCNAICKICALSDLGDYCPPHFSSCHIKTHVVVLGITIRQ